MPELAAVANGMTVLPGKIIGGHKTVHRPRGTAPPDGIADEYGVIAVPVGNLSGNQRHIPQGFIVMFAGDAAVFVGIVEVSGGVRFGGSTSERLRPDGIGNQLGNTLGGTGGGVVNDQRLTVCGGFFGGAYGFGRFGFCRGRLLGRCRDGFGGRRRRGGGRRCTAARQAAKLTPARRRSKEKKCVS